MARREKVILIEAEGRDKGKSYLIREMSAEAAEAWATRLLLALSRAGVEMPDNFLDMGMAGVAAMGIRAMGGLSWEVAKPLMDEMMACVHMHSFPGATQQIIPRPLIPDDIEEISTRVKLREAVLEVHTGFSISGFISNLTKTRQEALDRAVAEVIGEDIETSRTTLQE